MLERKEAGGAQATAKPDIVLGRCVVVVVVSRERGGRAPGARFTNC
jgi:hypothetical protein